MKRRKRDAADELVGRIMAAVRDYHRTKDAPELGPKQLSMIATELTDDGRWRCPHLEQCSHRAMCAVKLSLPEKYPVKESA